MNLTRFLVGRPLLTSMFFGVIVLLGMASVVQLPISSMPDIDYPYVIVQLENPGASATSVKHDITDPVEDAISQLGSVKSLTGVSSVGMSMVVVELTDGTDVNTAASDVAQAVNRSARALPDGVGSPTITKINPTAFPALVVNFSGADLTAIADSLDRDVVPSLRLVDGVGQVELVGDRPTVTSVTVDTDRLVARGMTISQVTSAISGQNVTSAAGSATTGGTDAQIRVAGRAATGSQLAELVVGTSGGQPVRLKDVATLRDGPSKASSVSQLNGRPTVSLQITPKSGSNLLTMAEAAKKSLESTKGTLPAGTTMVVTSDNSEFTWASVSATAEDLVLAVLLASLVVLLFLQSFRQTIIVLVAIPTSLLATTFMMRLLDFSIDIVSLLGMSLLIGVLVDDAVVVIENITRHLGMGKSRVDAAVDGRTEIAGAAVALTLVDVIVFTPIAVAPGLVGKILIEMALTVVVATLFSLLVSFTLTPMLAARWLKPHDPHHRPAAPARVLAGGLAAIDRGYVRVLRASLRHRFTVLVVGVCSLLTAIGLATSGKLGTAAIPDVDSNALAVSVTLPSGTSLERSTQVLTDLSDRFATVPNVVNVVGSAGSGGFLSAGGAGSVTMNLTLVDKNERSLPLDEIKKRVSAQMDGIPGARSSVTNADSGNGGGGGLPVVLKGTQLSVLQGLSQDVVKRLRARPELTSVASDASELSPSWDIALDRQAAGRLGVSTAQILAAVSAATDSGAEVSALQTDAGRDQKIRVSLATGPDGLGLAELKALPVALSAAGGAAGGGADASSAAAETSVTAPRPVTLGQVATVRRSAAPQTLNDVDQLLQVTVNAYAATGVSQSAAQKAIDDVMAGVTMPAGYAWSIGGAVENQSEIFLPLILSIGLSPILIYMLLAALYESLVLPFAVLLAQPLAVVGALVALWAGGSTLNMFSLIGMVLLIGLVSKNGILLIDRTEQKRREGLSAVEALAEAGRVRLRPILMTSMTLVVAMLPIALSTSSGSEYRTPLALVLIGGMSSSTILTMLVVPTLYTLLDAMRERIPRGVRGLLRGRVPGGLSRRTASAHAAAAGQPGQPGQPVGQHDTDPRGIRILTPNGRD